MDNKNHVQFNSEGITEIEENGVEHIISLNPDDNGRVGSLYVLGPAMPEFDGGEVLISYYKLIMNNDGKLALLEL